MFFNSMLKQRITELEQQLKNDREVIGYLKEANKRLEEAARIIIPRIA